MAERASPIQVQAKLTPIRRLLNDMSEFVGKQTSPCVEAWSIRVRPEYDVATYGVSTGVHCTGRCVRLVIRVHPYLAEVVCEARFKERAGRRVHRLAW